MSDPIDHQVLAVSRLLTQFREAANFIAYIEAFTEQSNELEDMFQELLDDRWIDTAEGAQLNIIADIVGTSRVIPEYDSEDYFGFDGAIGAGTFSTLAAPTTGYLFRSLANPPFIAGELTDTELRLYINAKIQKNITGTTIDDVIEVFEILLPSTDVVITEDDATFDMDIDGTLTDIEKLKVSHHDMIPKPAGVSITYQDDNGNFI